MKESYGAFTKNDDAFIKKVTVHLQKWRCVYKENFDATCPPFFLFFVKECLQTYCLVVWSCVLLLVTFWGKRKLFLCRYQIIFAVTWSVCAWELWNSVLSVRRARLSEFLMLHGSCLVLFRGERLLCRHACGGFYGIPSRRSRVWLSRRALALSLYQLASTVAHMRSVLPTPKVMRKMAAELILLFGLSCGYGFGVSVRFSLSFWLVNVLFAVVDESCCSWAEGQEAVNQEDYAAVVHVMGRVQTFLRVAFLFRILGSDFPFLTVFETFYRTGLAPLSSDSSEGVWFPVRRQFVSGLMWWICPLFVSQLFMDFSEAETLQMTSQMWVITRSVRQVHFWTYLNLVWKFRCCGVGYFWCKQFATNSVQKTLFSLLMFVTGLEKALSTQ